MDLLYELFWCRGIECLPALEEFDIAVPLIEISREESFDIFVRSALHSMVPRLVGADQVRDARLRLVE